MIINKFTYQFFIIFYILICHHLLLGDADEFKACGRTECQGGDGKFKYGIGKIYQYEHKVDVSVDLGNNGSTSDLHIESTVVIKFLTKCEGELKIKKSSIRHATRGKYDAEFPDRAETDFKEHLEYYNIRFVFNDGKINELCPHPDDSIWSVNIKRGILSMMQNSMNRFDVDHHSDELDINGICDTRYMLHEARKTSLIIKKYKNLYSCTNRGKHLSIIQSEKYHNVRTNLQSSLLNSAIDCEIIIDHNIYQSVICNELHRLQPLSSGDASVKTLTHSSLILIDESSEDDGDDTNGNYDVNDNGEQNDDNRNPFKSELVPTNLLYDHLAASFSSRSVYGELRTSRDLLKSMCLLRSSGQFEQPFSEIFSKFIHSARFLDYYSLSQLLKRSDGICNGGRNHILNSLPFIRTNAAVKVMRDEMLKETVDIKTSHSWMLPIAMIPRPDISTVAALSPLLELENKIPDGHLILVYSAVIRSFCVNNAGLTNSQRLRSNFLQKDDCLAVKGTGIDRFLDRLEVIIENGCAPRYHDPEDSKKTLEALKAIGNMGLERKGLTEKLERCMKNEGGFIPMEIRIASIDAHRRLPSCRETRDRIFLPYYRNFTLEPEIRIASYLQTMRCPDYNVVKTIKHILKVEPVNQVGSFVWSHLTNLIGSSSPTRIEIQSLLSDRDLSDKFNSDARKYSRNYEKSFFSEEYNIGGTFQANVIFSSKSYVPRTLTFNMTIDLFGESVNFLEGTMRMEGMEYYAEKFFGPNGPLANDKLSHHFTSFLRGLRSTDSNGDDDIDSNSIPNVIDNNFDDPRITLSYKIFGNDLDFTMLKGPDEIAKSLASLDPWSKIKRVLSGREIHFEHTGMFLDSTYVIPSTTGLPIRLDLSGSASCSFKFSGLLDSERLIKNTEMKLVGNLAPSISLDVTGKMTVDAFYKSAAVKIRSNVYSSSAVRLRLDIKGIELVRLHLELPNRKLEVFTAQTDIILINANGAEVIEKPALPLVPNTFTIISNSTCSWPVIERLIGLKLCFDYKFPNVTEISNAPYFLLSGPTHFRTSVIKADPSAESYLFEYSWNATSVYSVLKLAFDTPGSKVNRESSVTVKFDALHRNVSVLLRSAGNSLVAEGTYKRTDDETMINVGLDVNGTKHLDGYIGYSKKKIPNGYVYTPKLDLSINNEKVVELSGTVEDNHKNNVSQCNIDLIFKTKKIKSQVTGYIIRRNIGLNGNIKLDYQLRDMKKETLQIEIALLNRSTKTLTHKEANFKIQSTAYPQLNAIITSWYQQALGHLELHVEINAKPHLKDDRHKLTAQLVLTYSRAYFQSQEAKMTAFIAVSKPIQNLDIKVGIQRFSMGPASKTHFLIRYAPGKEITLAVNLIMPRGSMLVIEGHANMTIPNFDSMLIDVRINEKSRGEYDIDLAGTWFSGHNATVRGTYADRSSIIGERYITYHTIKLILRSPSVEKDILINGRFYRDYRDTKFDINIEYLNSDRYALKIEHSVINLGQFTSYAEARFRNNVFTITTNVDAEREVRLELHLDNWRDIHIAATAINSLMTKEYGFEIKWDANRDPELKLLTLFQLKKSYDELPLVSRNVSATLMIAYPGRHITGSCLLGAINTHHYIVDAYLDWDPTKSIQLTMDTSYVATDLTNHFQFDSQILTPFDQWKKTSLNSRFYWGVEKLSANCDVHWQDDQRFRLDFTADAQEMNETSQWRATSELTSTAHGIDCITVNLSHKYTQQFDISSIDSRFHVNYNPENLIDVRSIWQLYKPLKPDDNTTLAGNLKFISPFSNYKSGDIKSQIRMLQDWKFDGFANIEIDKRKYTGVLKGDLAKIKESMIEFNVTTTLEKYSFVCGRFGLSEKDRHVVAELVIPSGPIGIEALCQIFTGNNYDFNIMLKVSTPIDALQRFLIISKLGKTEADFRLRYNNITAGIQAIWHYNNITDFHYSYVLFTPIHGLHESGVVAKLIILDSNENNNVFGGIIDTEFSIRIVDTKLGIKAKTGPKFSPLQVLVLDKSFDESFEPEPDDFNWRGDVEINTVIIKPVTVNLDIDKQGPYYKIIGRVKIPQGKVMIDNTFVLEDYFNMKNTLEIKTPFSSLAEINSLYIFKIDLENQIYFLNFDLNINKINSVPWIKSGIIGNYSYAEGDEDDFKSHVLHLIIKTPLESLEYIDTHGVLELDETNYKTNINLKTNNSEAKFYGSLELEDAFLDGTVSVYINSTVLNIVKTKLNIKKDFTESEKRVECGLEIGQFKEKYCQFKATWLIESKNHAKVSIAVDTSVQPIRNIDISLLYTNNLPQNQNLIIQSKLKALNNQEYQFTGVYQPNGKINADFFGSNDMNYHFEGVVESMNKLTGRLLDSKTSKVYLVDGNLNVDETNGITLMDGLITFTSDQIDQSNQPYTLTFNLNREKNGVIVKVTTDSVNGSVKFNYINPLNWKTNIETNYSQLNSNGEVQMKRFLIDTFTNVQTNGNTSVYLNAETPWQDLTNFQLDGNIMLGDDGGNFKIKHHLNDDIGRLNIAWKLSYMIDMFLKLNGAANEKDVDVSFYFINPKRSFQHFNVGFDINIDKKQWQFATNTTVGCRNSENIDAIIYVTLPPPNKDDHRFLMTYHANKGIKDAKFVVGYSAVKAKKNYATDGSILIADRNLDAHLRFIWGDIPIRTINNILNVTFESKLIGLKYLLYTPKYEGKETAAILFNYDGTPVQTSLIDIDLYYPANERMGTAHISFSSFSNVNGTFNVTTFFKKVPFVASNIVVLTTLKQNKRFAQVFWLNDSALFNSDYLYHSEKLDSNLNGIIQLEIPLSTRHVAELDYGYKKRPQVTTGHAELVYNKNKILLAKYNSKGESRAGFEKDSIKITIENSYQPLGINYINQYEYSGGNAGTNYPTVEWKRVNVYRLDNSSAFNIAGESRIKTFHEGQEIHLKAEHFNRTVQLKTDYQVLPGEFDHNLWIGLAKDAWGSYKLNIVNKTTEDVENQFVIIDVAYPWRNFSLKGSYFIADSEFNSEANLSWNKSTNSNAQSSDDFMTYEEGMEEDNLRERTIGAAFLWKNISIADDSKMEKQMAMFSLKHPTLTKDATITGYLNKGDSSVLFNASVIIDYSENIDKLFQLSTIIKNETTDSNNIRYSYSIDGNHPKTHLNLYASGYFYKNSTHFLQTDHQAVYKRSYLPEETGKLQSKIDINNYEIDYHRESNDFIKHFDISYYPNLPEYIINGSMIDSSKDINTTGLFYLDIKEKLTWMMMNFTPDASENLRMYGNIPDARNVIFDIWRRYKRELFISDVSFYLKLNHSRLVSSTMKWRPELKNDLRNLVRNFLASIYTDVNNDIDYWKLYVRNEFVSAFNDIWEDSQEELKIFVDDWNNLKELDDDLTRLKVYLNDSYNDNDFYIKDLVAVGIYIIDELALRSHIESLPNIFTEIWEIMGESGVAIRNSILWIIEATKNAYKKLSELVSAILKGESFEQIANIVEKLLEKYDKFVKDIHVSFIKYVENLWSKLSIAVSKQWDKTLKLLEPLFIRILHYLEALVWKLSKNFVDFLYDRRNELIKSPYFDRFHNFTQDVDKFYRDIKSNDIITNIRKYSGIVINFIRERYFTMVPFGQELKDLVDEIISELAELKKLPTVNYILEKIHYGYDRLEYFYEYFGIQRKIESTIRLIHNKLRDISQTALQAESKYRQAKTKFIFDPNVGLMCLEQKLPMSWHAFNQTPEFQEIPEYRALIDFKNYFTTSNTTFWTLYYRYKPYTDPSNWLPPFKAQAMLVGNQHYVTFDGKHFNFIGNGTYLLARDFINNYFNIYVSYNPTFNNNSTINHQLIVSIGHESILIDVFNDTVQFINSNDNLSLPIELANGVGFVYQEENIVTIELDKNQMKIKCNLKYDVCTVELSGWFYGKTAGLFGTMNNEQWDDTLSSNGILEHDIPMFANSWLLPNQSDIENKRYNIINFANVGNTNEEALDFCFNLFSNKSSEFSDCFMVVEPQDYAEACINARSMSEACTITISYMQICSFYDTYLRIPDKCTACYMEDGSKVSEGEFRQLDRSNVSNSTDVVFIVEAKSCNFDIRKNRSIDQLIPQLNKELNDRGLKNNRWSLVIFGGNGVYNKPRNLILDNHIFTNNATKFVSYFDNIHIGNGNEDIFAAIGFASQLVFRAGVSKTFILIPCSHCEPQNQTFDYSVLHQVLLEHDITLHILMDNGFYFTKQRLNNIFYGLDATRSYTKKDVKVLSGDVDLRRQVKLPKSVLGYCTPLSLETNGTIFSANKLQIDNQSLIKKFITVFAKRVALTAEPSFCQHCECTADNDGVTQLECVPCIYPMPVSVDYAIETFNEDDSLSSLPSMQMPSN